MTIAGRLARTGVAAALVALPAAVPGLLATAASAAAPVSPPPAPAYPVHVAIVGIDPVAPQPHTEVTVTADVTNVGEVAIEDYEVELRLGYHQIASRGELAADAASTTHFNSDVPDGARLDVSRSLPPGSTRTVRLRFSPDALQHQQPNPLLTSYGVYQLGVEVHDPDEGNPIIGLQNTFLPWLPADGYGARTGWNRLRIAWLWPLSDVPHVGPSGPVPDKALAAELAPGGRLDRLLTVATGAGAQHGRVRLPAAPRPPAAPTPPGRKKGSTRPRHPAAPAGPTLTVRPVPVSYAVDPALVDVLATATTSDPHGRAAGYLDTLRAHVTTSDLIALPYADPDPSALVRHGAAGQLRSADNARDAVLAANRFPRAVLGVTWPASGFLSASALAQLTTPYVVLDGAAAPPLAPLSYTPTAVTQLPRAGGPVTALLSDPTLAGLATTQVTGETAALVEQRFAAETAMILAERPGLTRDVVVALPHRFDPSGTIVDRLLADSGQLPWLEPITVSDLVQDPPDPAALHGMARYPAAARRAEFPASYVGAITATGHAVGDLRALLCVPVPAGHRAGATGAGRCGPDRLALPLEHALLAAASSAWQDDVGDGRQLLDATAHAVHGYLAKVRITTAGSVTLVSQTGSIPITVANDLPLPVTVRLDITTPNRAQLRVGGPSLYTIPPGAKTQQTIQARTSSAGKARFPIFVRLETPNGDPVGESTELVVRSSAYGVVALAITGGALAVLFGTVAVRLTRTALRARGGAGAEQ